MAQVPGALPPLIAAVAADDKDVAETAAHAVGVIKSWAESAVAVAGTACAHCGARADKAIGKRLRVCTGCGTTRYCNAECQRLAWGSHKAACPAVVATRASSAGA